MWRGGRGIQNPCGTDESGPGIDGCRDGECFGSRIFGPRSLVFRPAARTAVIESV